MFNLHKFMETRSVFLLIGILVAVAIGGLVEIVPLFYLGSTIEKVEGMRPCSTLELAGRNIYIREGCYNCHSQMVRSLRDEGNGMGRTASRPRACTTIPSSGAASERDRT
jgi:cytochrome c oxidase cbb3-type subunit 2